MKKTTAIIISLFALALFSLSDNEDKDISASNSINFVKDPGFNDGFSVLKPSKKDLKTGKGIIKFEDSKNKPKWSIAQWDSKSDISLANPVKLPDGAYRVSDDYKTMEVKPGGESPGQIMLEVFGTKEYGRLSRKEGESWPHLLLGQRLDQQVKLGELSELKLNIDARVKYCKSGGGIINSDLHAAQVTLFITVKDPESGEFLWFGVPFFDSRKKSPHQERISEDGGKADASHKLIYIAAQKEFTNKSFVDGKWITYNQDLLGFIKDAVKEAYKRKYFKVKVIDNLVLTSFNIGWEIPGSYDAAFEFKGFQIAGKYKNHPSP